MDQNTQSLLRDADALMGIGYADITKTENLLGQIMSLPTTGEQTAAFQQVLRKGQPHIAPSGGHTGRDKAAMRIGMLPPDIQKGLTEKRLQLVDSFYYAVKVANAVNSVRMLLNTDTKAPGVGNIAFQKFDKDQWFLCTHIGLTSGVDASSLNASFGVIPIAVSNGDFEFKANGKYLMPKDTSLAIFNTTNRTDVDQGVYELDSPKWIEPQIDIIMDLRFSENTVANTNLKFLMIGQTVQPY
jgi:hypothetical protein